MEFIVIQRSGRVPSSGRDIAYLSIDNWNDYSFVTMFDLVVYDEEGQRHDLEKVKIGFRGQDTSIATHQSIADRFETLTEEYFSLGLEVEYYRKMAGFSAKLRNEVLRSLRDIVFNESVIDSLLGEQVFQTSLLRGVSLSVIRGQFKRVLDGGVPLTDFEFKYVSPETKRMAAIELVFEVKADSLPSTNIHAIIGRNGVGKTTILNGMTEAVTKRGEVPFEFRTVSAWSEEPISNDYFSSLVSVSFSAFDPFMPPPEQPNPALGTCYYYIGIKGNSTDGGVILKPLPDLHKEFVDSISICMSQDAKKERWRSAIAMLESDENFAEMNLAALSDYHGVELQNNSKSQIQRMSSGHAVVLITITKLVATVEEKTLVLIDEPESHLHPPLLSAFIRALSQLLHDRNGVAIIATHSPVVLQEIPQSCAWKILRSRLVMTCGRPDIQTFGENVGVLIREIFGLEVAKSGFHQLLADSVESGRSYDEILNEYGEQLGNEARAILMAMIVDRDGVTTQ